MNGSNDPKPVRGLDQTPIMMITTESRNPNLARHPSVVKRLSGKPFDQGNVAKIKVERVLLTPLRPKHASLQHEKIFWPHLSFDIETCTLMQSFFHPKETFSMMIRARTRTHPHVHIANRTTDVANRNDQAV